MEEETAIKNNIMIGSVVNGQKTFNPKGILTRAEAAVLLMKIIETDDEKIVLDDSNDEKIVLNDSNILLTIISSSRAIGNW